MNHRRSFTDSDTELLSLVLSSYRLKMLRQAGCVARRKSSTVRLDSRSSARSHSTSSKLNSGASGSRHLDFKLPIAALAGSASAAVLVYSYAKTNPISNEAYPKATSPKVKDSGPAPVIWDDEHLLTIAWGSNKYVCIRLLNVSGFVF